MDDDDNPAPSAPAPEPAPEPAPGAPSLPEPLEPEPAPQPMMLPQPRPRRSRKPLLIFIILTVIILVALLGFLLMLGSKIPEKQGPGGTGVTECASNFSCFLAALDSCNNATVVYEDARHNATLGFELTGGEPGACDVHIAVTQAADAAYLGESVDCRMSRQTHLNFFEGGGDTCAACSGSLIDATGVC